MKKKIFIMLFLVTISVLFNIHYTYAYTYKKSIHLETMKNASRANMENYIKSTYGSNSDMVLLHPSGNSVISLNTSLKCITTAGDTYKLQVGKRKKC